MCPTPEEKDGSRTLMVGVSWSVPCRIPTSRRDGQRNAYVHTIPYVRLIGSTIVNGGPSTVHTFTITPFNCHH
jgi:hypothetical protein